MRELYYLTLTLTLWAASLCVPPRDGFRGTCPFTTGTTFKRVQIRCRAWSFTMAESSFEYRSDPYWQPIEAMAMTKSMTALADRPHAGRTHHLLRSTSLSTIFILNGIKAANALSRSADLLSHTSGLQADIDNRRNLSLRRYHPDCPLRRTGNSTGHSLFYNNKAVNLLSGIVKKATGRSLSEYLTVRLFAPLGHR